MNQLRLAEQITAFLDGVPTVRWPLEATCLTDDLWCGTVPLPIATQQVRLGRLRRSTLEIAVGRADAPYKVLLYAAVPTGEDPAPSLELAEAYAVEHGWRVTDRLVDRVATPEPWARQQWRCALKALRGGFAQGIVTVDRSAVSAADEPYEQTLHWMLDHFSFVAHVWPRPLRRAPASLTHMYVREEEPDVPARSPLPLCSGR